MELSFLDFFEAPTVAGMAAGIRTVGSEAWDRTVSPIACTSRDSELPLSFAQQRLWFFDQLDPGSPAYNRPTLLRFTGRLNVAVLEQCLNRDRPPARSPADELSSVDGRPHQVISPTVNLALPIVDLGESAGPSVRPRPASWLSRKASGHSI